MGEEAASVVETTRELARELALALAPFSVSGDAGESLVEALHASLQAWALAAREGAGEREPARTLGRRLVEAGCIEPDAMTVVLPALAGYLARVQPDQAQQMASLGAVVAGYAAALRERTLHHQEQLYHALRRSRDAARAQLVEETRFVNAILDHMEALVAVATPDGVITRFNRAAQRITGYTADELNLGMGRPLTPEENLPEVEEAIDRLMSGPDAPRSVTMRSRWRTRSGELRDIAWTASLLEDDEGNFTHVVGTGIDITSQLQIEAELNEARQKLAEREGLMQRRLARALHDGPVQELMRLGMLVAEMQDRAESETPWTPRQRLEEMIPGLELVRREILAAASRLRHLVGVLRPPGLEEMGLRQAVEALLHSDELQKTPMRVTVAMPDDVDSLAEQARATLYYIIREALLNAQRHARATEVQVVLSRDEGEVRLDVRDNGRGFETPDRLARLVRQQQYGLIGMQERVQLQGGQLEIESSPGRGTIIRASLPA
jgi:PAS domain S-box-containing protein